MSAHAELRRAEFNASVCTYWLLSGAIVFTVTIVGIPLLLLWFPIGYVFTKRYLDRMECVLTEKALKVKKGILVRTEKTIPLEKITDMGMVQGPIMRAFDLYTLSVETAGQSGEGALVSLTGIQDAKGFREAVLEQRDVLAGTAPATSTERTNVPGSDEVLVEIRDALLRIEARLDRG